MTRSITMRRLLSVAMAATLSLGLVGGWAVPHGASAQDPANGQRLYIAQGCYVCHGERGEWRFHLKGTILSLAEVASQIRDPRGSMPFFTRSELSDEGIADIYAWLTSE